MITYRWIDGISCTDLEWSVVDKILEKNGWMPLNRQTSRVYLAENEGQIIGILCLQLMPFVGPLWVDKKNRGTGISDKLIDDGIEFMKAATRGWFIVADSPHIPKHCERHGMRKITSPVYITDTQGQQEEVA